MRSHTRCDFNESISMSNLPVAVGREGEKREERGSDSVRVIYLECAARSHMIICGRGSSAPAGCDLARSVLLSLGAAIVWRVCCPHRLSATMALCAFYHDATIGRLKNAAVASTYWSVRGAHTKRACTASTTKEMTKNRRFSVCGSLKTSNCWEYRQRRNTICCTTYEHTNTRTDRECSMHARPMKSALPSTSGRMEK